jgi:hypothetical protein
VLTPYTEVRGKAAWLRYGRTVPRKPLVLAALVLVALIAGGTRICVSATALGSDRKPIPLNEAAAETTAEHFLDLYAPTISPYRRGHAACEHKQSLNVRRCKLRWQPGRTSGEARIEAFVNRRGQRLATIRYKLHRKYSCPGGGNGDGICVGHTRGVVVFRLRSGR